MFDHVLSLSFGTAQVCRQAERYIEFTSTYVKQKVMGTYQVWSLSELEVDFDLFY